MIKKIALIILLFCTIISCGKKNDPEYIDPNKKTKVKTKMKSSKTLTRRRSAREGLELASKQTVNKLQTNCKPRKK